ncbi:MAG: Hydroxymethylbutenyl pyrophosphate reductase [Candidatus Moranbacteria bacterium GW2011_GWF2_36_839]|nr:MAG: Hydroxymethylbutenyl pyrophosphate reductase [Candidatus Moranbacteria bacterium GW2011_GWF1_36_78]KKQ16282.1 MAG: Hydroxymethylbutenyl pyrophosphate reductase [Candidatus Moranbacteria bacterium GW2011_GWF2_36_839]HBY11110.1 4-hydroxy-3-methylbut-2-enyl diphosphate reductase [Candidatus Moranbacteria bacterium]
MKIHLSQFAGFCDGVRRAYEMISALDIAQAKKPIYILGSLAHNADVVREIHKKGIFKIDLEDFLQSKKGEIGTIIVTAHGVGPEIFDIAKEKDIEIIDTTCPKVIKVQRLAKVFSARDYSIILIGDKGHKEVEGINSWGRGKSRIVSTQEDLENLDFSKNEKIIVLSQTTQSEEFFEKAGNFIKNKFPDTQIISTICYTTHDRQGEISKLAQKNDVVVVIGSKESANSTRLFEIAKEKNPQTYFIENSNQLEKKWFLRVEKALVTAGASTPSWVIEEVVKEIEKL